MYVSIPSHSDESFDNKQEIVSLKAFQSYHRPMHKRLYGRTLITYGGHSERETELEEIAYTFHSFPIA